MEGHSMLLVHLKSSIRRIFKIANVRKCFALDLTSLTEIMIFIVHVTVSAFDEMSTAFHIKSLFASNILQ